MIAPPWSRYSRVPRLLVCTCLIAGAASPRSAAQLPAARAVKASHPIAARQPALSADGNWLAFSLHGDVWRCSSSGGVAERVTVHAAYDGYPAWSPDAKWIAFSSDREGSYDVYVMPAGGGIPRRMTQHPGDDFVCDWSPDGSELLFASDREGDPPDLYAVELRTGMIRRVTSETLGARYGRYSPDGATIFFSAGNREWWQWRRADGAFTEIRSVSARGGPSKPIAGGEGFVCMPGVARNRLFWVESDGTGVGIRSGSMTSGGTAPIQMAAPSPISWLTCARGSGLLVIERDGRLWSCDTDKALALQAVHVDARSDTRRMAQRTERQQRGFQDLSVSPDGKRVAFAAGGDVWMAPIGGGDATRLTAAAGAERSPTWSPDGKRIAYVAVRNDRADLFECDVESRKETRLTDDVDAESEPRYAPDGRRIAYVASVRAGAELRVVYLDAPPSEPLGNRTILARSAKLIGCDWSPDGRWLVYSAYSGPDVCDLYVVPAVGGTVTNLTRSAGRLERPVWSRNGAMVAAIGSVWNDRGSPGRGVVIVDLQRSPRSSEPPTPLRTGAPEGPSGSGSTGSVTGAGDPWSPSPANRPDMSSQRPRRRRGPPPPDGPPPDVASPAPPWPFGPPARPPDRVVIDLADAHTRVRSAASVPGSVEAMAFAADGRSLALVVRSSDGVWIAGADSLSSAVVRLAPVAGAARPSMLLDGSALVFLDGDGVIRILRRGATAAAAVNITCTYDWDRREVVREAVANLWQEVYQRTSEGERADPGTARLRLMLAETAAASDTPEDLATALLSSVGQVGPAIRDARVARAQADRTGFLGLDFDQSYAGPGLRISRVVPGGPADQVANAPGAGEYIHSLNDVPCTMPEALWAELRGMAGRAVRIVVAPTPPNGDGSDQIVGKRTVTLRAISRAEFGRLRDREWDGANEERVEQLSSGTCRYIRLRSFDSTEVRALASALVTDRGKVRSVIVDLRDLRTDENPRPVADLLLHASAVAGFRAGAPVDVATLGMAPLPVVLLVNERTSGSAEVVAMAFRQSGRGEIVGAPTAGWCRSYRPYEVWDGVTVDLADEDYTSGTTAEADSNAVKLTGPSIRGRDDQLSAAVAAAIRLGERNLQGARLSPFSAQVSH